MRSRRSLFDPVVTAVAAAVGGGLLVLGRGPLALVGGAAVFAAGHTPNAVRRIVQRPKLPPPGSAERALVLRARSAVRTARRLSRAAPAGPLADRTRTAAMQLEPSLEGISRLAGQSVAVRDLARGIDPGAGQRLQALSGELGERTEALVASLESVVASLIEALALAGSDPGGHALAALERVGAEVEALRSGLVEAQSLSRRAALMEVMEDVS